MVYLLHVVGGHFLVCWWRHWHRMGPSGYPSLFTNNCSYIKSLPHNSSNKKFTMMEISLYNTSSWNEKWGHCVADSVKARAELASWEKPNFAHTTSSDLIARVLSWKLHWGTLTKLTRLYDDVCNTCSLLLHLLNSISPLRFLNELW